MTGAIQRVPFDVATYTRRTRTGPCFICAIVNGDPGQPEETVYDDGDHIAEYGVVEHTREAAALAAGIRRALDA
ncbi:hypothetical protein [Nonomuraea sediminis]|uniref:hypothetical protein n=1 Tax=Nonomuraea sediminis TaxID=2835864 RepID=UPI001BDC4CFE|nr:hypothetical protein [Nonomuraea sediminis]